MESQELDENRPFLAGQRAPHSDKDHICTAKIPLLD
jgi:hypothetical protein